MEKAGMDILALNRGNALQNKPEWVFIPCVLMAGIVISSLWRSEAMPGLVLCPHHRAACDTRFIPCKHGLPHELQRSCGLVCLSVSGPAGACQTCQPLEVKL